MRLGTLSAQYESNSGPGCVSDGQGDLGGISYGSYQFATNAGTPSNFVDWLLVNEHRYGDMLTDAGEPGSLSFSSMWIHLANSDPEGFADLQHTYVQSLYFEPAIHQLAAIGFNALSRSNALLQVLWSRAVQYGPGWMTELFTGAAAMAGKDLYQIHDQELIWYIYELLIVEADNAVQIGSDRYRSPDDWINGSADVVYGLRNRFVNERQDALVLLEAEGGAA